MLDALMQTFLRHLGRQVAELDDWHHLQPFDIGQPYLTSCIHDKVSHNLFDFHCSVYCLKKANKSLHHLFNILLSNSCYLLLDDIGLELLIKLN